ncbi:response regulator [Algoriphagus sp. H41]|uniref:Response regulator n=1 Tax=Algoriphagus oliviformis TaxID=2811231 RepID=A0ABS3C953_9BACT|nr:response regulator [Algoriphagus oliviformis]MBN7813512.1 response regulator [Algoriphagus oliviformis]
MVREGGLCPSPSVFSSAEEALESIYPIDEPGLRILVFLDINMPRVNAWDFLKLISENINYADIRVVIVSSSLSWSDREKSKEYDAVLEFWEKPMDEEQVASLKTRMATWLNGF